MSKWHIEQHKIGGIFHHYFDTEKEFKDWISNDLKNPDEETKAWLRERAGKIKQLEGVAV